MRHRIIYTGQRLDNKSKIVHRFIVAESGKQLIFSKNLLKINIVGLMGEAETEDEEVWSNFSLINERYENEEDIRKWSAEDRAAKEEHRFLASVKKKQPEDIETILTNLSVAASGMTYRQREMLALYAYRKILGKS